MATVVVPLPGPGRVIAQGLVWAYCAFRKPGSLLTHAAGGLLIRGLIANRLVLDASTLAAVSSLIFCMPAAPSSLANLSESWMLLSVSARDFIRLKTRKVCPPP